MLVTDAQGYLTHINRQAEKILGFSVRRHIGAFISDLLPLTGPQIIASLKSGQPNLGHLIKGKVVDLVLFIAPSTSSGRVQGAVCTFQEMGQFETSARKLESYQQLNRELRTYALVDKLVDAYGAKNSVTCIGPAGEQQLSAASIQTTDMDGHPCRAAGRGGLGAVMGAKGLKALIISRAGKAADSLVDAEAFKSAAKAYAKAVKENEFSGEILPEMGSACLVEAINEVGAFPTRNAREGQLEHADRISGETMARTIRERGGKTTH